MADDILLPGGVDIRRAGVLDSNGNVGDGRFNNVFLGEVDTQPCACGSRRFYSKRLNKWLCFSYVGCDQ